jgi:hypothetical protein
MCRESQVLIVAGPLRQVHEFWQRSDVDVLAVAEIYYANCKMQLSCLRPKSSLTDCNTVYFVAFRWLCESLILNLLIGITFNNFTFLTDDVNHVETPDW